MHLYILERTPLSAVDRLDPAPKRGDVVAYLRAGQDPGGLDAAKLWGNGIEVVSGERLVDRKTSVQIQELAPRFTDEWYFDNGKDISEIDGISLGQLVAVEPVRRTNPRFVVRTGEIVRRLIDANPNAELVLSDLVDGDGVVWVGKGFMPLRSVTEYVARTMGREFRDVVPVDPLPPWVGYAKNANITHMVRTFVGGFRPGWIKQRLTFKRKRRARRSEPVVYVMMGNSSRYVAEKLAASKRFHVVTDQLGIPGCDGLRFDHMASLPQISHFRRALGLYRHVRKLARHHATTDRYSINGINYGPILAESTAQSIKWFLPLALFVFSQMRKLRNETNFAASIHNGEGGVPPRSLILLNTLSDRRMYYLRHAMNTHHFNTKESAHNFSNVTYLSCGTDHVCEFGRHLPEDRKPRCPVVGSPLTVAMNEIRGRRPVSQGRRVLILNYGFGAFLNHGRVRTVDAYFVEIFGIVRMFHDEGWRFTYRPHPGCLPNLEKRIARDMGVADIIRWDDHPDLSSALLENDVVVSNISSTHYQTLYAGWPTICYEPSFDDEQFEDRLWYPDYYMGLLAADDIEQPLTTKPERLADMIRETLDPTSPTSTFPARFVAEYGDRFIGPDPEHADARIAEFLIDDLSNLTADDVTSRNELPAGAMGPAPSAPEMGSP